MSNRREGLADVLLPIPVSHPAFEGHFPGEPILPGVALLDLVVTALRKALGEEWWVSAMPSVRWRAVVRPGESLRVHFDRLAEEGRVGFRVWSGDRLVSDGTLVASRTGS